MTNITIGRYAPGSMDEGGAGVDAYAGWIEGTREDGTTWITYLAADGSPVLHWSTRTDTGAVVGDPVHLA